MCIIAGPVYNVSRTKLFVLPSLDKSHQLTMYSNSVDTQKDNLMILPVPHASSLKLHNIKGRKTLFKELQKSVYYPRPPQTRAYGSASLRSCALSVSDTLEVHDYGSYLVSIAPSLLDLFRLDTSIFQLPPSLYEFFAEHYNEEFGYLCCKLKPGRHSYEPVVYSHPLHSSGKLFVPTLHYHVHENGSADTHKADWDHEIYSCGTTEDANFKYLSLKENVVHWKRLPSEFQWTQGNPIRCAGIDGYQKNQDLTFDIIV